MIAGRFTKFLAPSLLFGLIFIIYFWVGSRGTFKPPWGLDYLNPLAEALRQGRLDLQGLGTTYDLSYFQGKWYAPWGALPALFLIPLQIIKGRFVPLFYVTLFFSGLNVAAVYLLLKRIRKEFFPTTSRLSVWLMTIFFAFGTAHFYVGTLPGTWHAEQIVSAFFTILGVYFIFKKTRRPVDYFLATVLISISLLGKANQALLVCLPILLYVLDHSQKKNWRQFCLVFILPLFIFTSLFLLYNYARFGHPLEAGHAYINESPHFTEIHRANGMWSLKTIPRNFWQMVLEMPSLTRKVSGQVALDFNLDGNSIFFLAPPLLAIFLALPTNPYVFSLWLTLILTALPILMYYSTGWMQFGYRYSLDFLVILMILSVFGTKGKVNFLYFLGIIFAVWLQVLGIKALQ